MPTPQLPLSVVAPCYNESEGLRDFVARTTAACESAVGSSYELILVNDGSTDTSWTVMQALQAVHPQLVLVDLARNHGHQLALSAGLAQARGELILILDSDLQDPPELLAPMLDILATGADVVYGQRRARPGESRFKRLSAHLFYRLLSWLADSSIPPDTGDFRLMRRNILDVLLAMPEAHRFVRGMVSWVGFTQVPLLYTRAPRHAGQTHYTLTHMLRLAVDAITSFSIRPLRLGILSALGGVGLAGLVALYALYSFFWLEAVPGWTSLLFIYLVFSSLQLFCLGMMGEYVGRTYLQSKNRPLFILREIRRAPQ